MPKKLNLVTKTEASERRGVSIPTLNYWISKGKLTEHWKNGKPWMNWEEVAAFPFKTDSKINERRLAQKRGTEAQATSEQNEEGEEDNPEGLSPEMLRLRKLQEAEFKQKDFKARQTELEYRKAAGELVSVAEVLRRWEDVAQLTKKVLLTVPDRVAPLVAGESDTRKCWEILTNELHQALENLNEEAINIYGSAIDPDLREGMDQPAEVAGADA